MRLPLRALPAIALLLAGPPAAALSPSEEHRVLAAIRRSTQRFLAAYQGVATLRRTVTRVYAPDRRQLLETRVADQRYEHLFYDRPRVQTIGCRIDGAVADRSRCEDRWQRLLPHIQVFDRRGEASYDVRIDDVVSIDGARCYRVDVRPRRQTPRHFVGQMYYRLDDLSLVRMEGSVAHLPFPLSHVTLKLAFERRGEGLVDVTRGYVDVWLRIPLLYSRRIVTRFTASGHRPLPR